MNKGKLMKVLAKWDNVDSARPIDFDRCIRDVEDGKLNSSCGFNPELWQIVWDYQDGNIGKPLSLGEELLNQVSDGKMVVMTDEQAKELYRKAQGVSHDDMKYITGKAIQDELSFRW